MEDNDGARDNDTTQRGAMTVCSGGVFGHGGKKSEADKRGRVTRGWAVWNRVLIGLPSHGVHVCLQGKVTGGNRSNEV